MNNDPEILQEALDLEEASTQMELAQMGFNDAVEIESNKTREMHELKPASWFAQTFNTDGEVKRREEAVKISTTLTAAKERKEIFSAWSTALNPAHVKFKKGPYQKIITELKKAYPSVSASSGQRIRLQAITGELDERNALLWAYGGQEKNTQFKQLQQQGANTAQALAVNAEKISKLNTPSLFAKVFNTPVNKSYKKQLNNLLEEKKLLEKSYNDIKEKREPLRADSIEYVKYGKRVISELESKHEDMKKRQDLQIYESKDTAVPTPKKTPAALWSAVKPSTASGITLPLI